ncbi:mitochondrial carrier domain-containing protein [Melampsora americana]|nr:mitochondrial carrier domain-containing protein [Melampsora americana]
MTTNSKSYSLSAGEGFVAGALGACVAVTFTNPMEVAKTRLQLDGELQQKGSPKTYANTYDVLRKMARSEGLKSCQRGLGFYEPIRSNISSLSGHDPSHVQLWSSISAGALSGVIGAIFGNPLFLVKARLQASASTSHSSRYVYRSAIDGLAQIFRQEGLKGMMRGVDAAMLRTAMGSSVQLPAYNYAKTNLSPYFDPNSVWLYIASSSFSGMCVLTAMQPADTTLTRMYNQPTDPGKRLYKNPLDCLWKTIKIEGFTGLYKGSTAHFFRIAPHTIITLVANESIVQWWSKRMLTA